MRKYQRSRADALLSAKEALDAVRGCGSIL